MQEVAGAKLFNWNWSFQRSAPNKADFQGQPLFHLYTVDQRGNEVPLLKTAACAHDERPRPGPRHEGATSASSKCGEARCRLTVPVKCALGDATWQFESPATCRTHKDAENAAALQAVRRIQLAHSRRASAVLPWDPPGAGEGAQGESLVLPKEETPGSVPGAGPRLVSEVEILHAGEEQPWDVDFGAEVGDQEHRKASGRSHRGHYNVAISDET